MIKALIFLLDNFSQLYLLLLLMRFWLPVLRANFQNPIAQGVLRYTSPLVVPVRRFVPPIKRLDTATVLVAFVIQFVVMIVISVLVSIRDGMNPLVTISGTNAMFTFAFTAIVKLAILSVILFIVAIVIRVILNILGRYLGPISDMLADLTEPLIAPIRRFIPPVGVVDLSAYITIMLLIALNMALSDLLM